MKYHAQIHAEHMNWITKPLSDALLAAPTGASVETRIFITRPKMKWSDTLATDTSSINASSPYSPVSADTFATFPPLARNAIKTENGRPDIETLIQDAVSLSSGPVSVDGKTSSALTSVC